MTTSWAARRRHTPEDPVGAAFAFFSLIAAAGFAVGWVTQAITL
jgi:hypothetical protein